jgi:hypothetical protein
MKYALIWAVMTIGPQGPVGGNLPETTKFESKEACEKFGEEMIPRMQDWIRGAVRADWGHPVRVTFKCDAEGRPT